MKSLDFEGYIKAPQSKVSVLLYDNVIVKVVTKKRRKEFFIPFFLAKGNLELNILKKSKISLGNYAKFKVLKKKAKRW